MLSDKAIFERIVLILSACLTCAGFIGVIYVIRMGILPSHNLMGHSREYEKGWRLFFMIFLGIPCFLAFLAGIMPWIIWRPWKKSSMKKKKAS
ncbi:MAG TPA: hypothetical protein PLR38_00860 [Syntrophorhabdaceae bacterium]|nr:hypothetical protein [Syntrophorhabdaceae bacterium]HOL06395.1 hypothetical protein [Syntrophorhabdaceae bacterium]HPP41532.1 hypothetical protein [Syntrophorhabdaceae bacterium]